MLFDFCPSVRGVTGSGPSSNDPGTQIVGLCIRQDLVNPCVPVPGPATIAIDLPGVVSGTIDVLTQVSRTTEGSDSGSGLTVTMLHIELVTSLLVSIVLDIAQADSFVGGVTQDTPTPSVPTSTPTPAAGSPSVGTPTPGPGLPGAPTEPATPPVQLPPSGDPPHGPEAELADPLIGLLSAVTGALCLLARLGNRGRSR